MKLKIFISWTLSQFYSICSMAAYITSALITRQYKRKTYDNVQNFGAWQAFVLTLTGVVGGVFSAVTGSGLDICSFSMLTLLFRWN